MFASIGIETTRTPVRSPRANAYAERFVRTIRQECLDHLLFASRRHLASVLADYVRHYNQAARLLRPRPSGRVRSSVLRWQRSCPAGAWKPIAGVSIRPRVVQTSPSWSTCLRSRRTSCPATRQRSWLLRCCEVQVSTCSFLGPSSRRSSLVSSHCLDAQLPKSTYHCPPTSSQAVAQKPGLLGDDGEASSSA
ncbi:MAG: integrase core domain-containing protein [Acidimicrobiales bacterium]